jgi:hypothetical protein
VRREYLLLSFRSRYNLSPRDPRLLATTRREIVIDYITQQEFDRYEAEIREKAEDESMPLCLECGFKGIPVYGGFCPRCGTKMQTGTVWEDPEFDKYLERLGVKREDIE